MVSNFFVTVIVDKNETKINLKPKNRLTSKTDYYKASQTKEKNKKTKWNQLNQIKENKNSFGTSFKPMWYKRKIWNYFLQNDVFRSRHRRCTLKLDALNCFENFTGKHLCRSLFLIKLQASGIASAELLQHIGSCYSTPIFLEHLPVNVSTLWNLFTLI